MWKISCFGEMESYEIFANLTDISLITVQMKTETLGSFDSW